MSENKRGVLLMGCFLYIETLRGTIFFYKYIMENNLKYNIRNINI